MLLHCHGFMIQQSLISSTPNVLDFMLPYVFIESDLPPAPNIEFVKPSSSTSFTVNWTSPVLNNHYTVIWTNLHTGVMYNRTVPGNTNSYTVTGLSGDVNYNVSVAAVNECGMNESDFVSVFGKCAFKPLQYASTFTVICLSVTSHLCMSDAYDRLFILLHTCDKIIEQYSNYYFLQLK